MRISKSIAARFSSICAVTSWLRPSTPMTRFHENFLSFLVDNRASFTLRYSPKAYPNWIVGIIPRLGKWEKHMSTRLAILLSVFLVSPVFGQRTISNNQTKGNQLTVDDVVMHDGMIVTLTHLKSGKIKLKFKTDENQEFTLDWKTLIYKLTDRNKKIYKEQDKLDDIVADVNKLKKRIKDIPDKEVSLLAHSWTDIYVSSSGRVHVWNNINRHALEGLSKAQMDYWRDEEDRQNLYGPPVKLVPKMTALLVADKGQDVTYAVLVTGKKEEAKKEKTVELISQDREAEAARKLKYAKQTLKDAESAKGEDREKLFELAQKKLQEVT